jgi:regulatory protein
MWRMARKRDIDGLKDRFGTYDAPIGTVQLPETGVVYDKRGNPKPLQSGQDEHEQRDPNAPRTPRKRKQPEPELAFATDLFEGDPRERAAMTTCYKVFSNKLVTERELRDKLVKAEHEPDMVEFALAKCRAEGLINDRAYATSWIESRIRRGHGARRIERDLQVKGIAKELVAEVLAEQSSGTELEDAALVAARKKAARLDLEDAATRAKVQRWLVGRGYSFGQADAALRTVRAEQADAAD